MSDLLGFSHFGQVALHRQIAVIEHARFVIDEAQHTRFNAIEITRRPNRVKTDTGFADDTRTTGDTLVLPGILEDNNFVADNGVAAKGDSARGCASVQPGPELEPLPVFISHADQRHQYDKGSAGHAVAQRMPSRTGHVGAG